MKNNDLIHLKIEYLSALESKKDLLNSEKNLMLTAKAMHNYASLRKKELKKRFTLARKAKELVSLLRKMRSEMPKVNVNESGKRYAVHETKIQTEVPIIKKKQSKSQDNIESQLQEIQRKLREIGN